MVIYKYLVDKNEMQSVNVKFMGSLVKTNVSKENVSSTY